MAVPKINSDRIHCNTLVFAFWPTFAPSGAAKILATIMTAAGPYRIWSVTILPTVEPMDEMNVIASEVAMVMRVGIRKTTSMIGTKMNAPAAPTIPAAIPTMNARPAAIHLLKDTWSAGMSSKPFLGINIMTTAMVARMA